MEIKHLLANGKMGGIISVGPDTTLRDTARTLLEHKIGALVVLDQSDRLLGIVSERDLIPLIADFSEESVAAPVSSVMTRNVITCAPTDDVALVLRLMETKGFRHMPVVENGRLLTMLSIRALTAAYEYLQVEANTDALTSVSTRRSFLRMLRREFDTALKWGEPISLAMLDIDHFKQVNDTFGHDAGDRVLRDVSALLIEQFRSVDLIGRLGGEEFALAFPKTGNAGARTACERIRTSVRDAAFKVNGSTVRVTVSIGLATRTSETLTDVALLKQADTLLYEAKVTGRDCLISGLV